MEWQAWGQQLMDVLELRRAPVAITYTDEAPAGAVSGRWRMCAALQQAAQGAVIDMTAENSACPGGSLYLGLQAQPADRQAVVQDFLIHGEKLFSCPAAIYRSTALSKVKPPFGLAPHVVFAALPQAPLPPDVAVFICNAWQGARLINLAYFETGAPMECDPTGSLCRSAVTYPLITNRVNVTFGDVTARRMERYGEDELFVSLPYSPLRSVVASLDRCSAGTAPVEIPPAMQRLMGELGGELLDI
jgi:uncharacterized protein (DUF169 family)